MRDQASPEPGAVLGWMDRSKAVRPRTGAALLPCGEEGGHRGSRPRAPAAEANGRPIGAAWLRLLIGNDKTFAYQDDRTPELAIAVRPEYVGQGVGTALLHQLLTFARGRYPAIVLSVREHNPARRLYERLGFRVVGEGVNRVGGRSLVMLCDV